MNTRFRCGLAGMVFPREAPCYWHRLYIPLRRERESLSSEWIFHGDANPFSRRVVRLVVRLRRQALPLPDLPDDVRLQVRRDGLEPDVLRGPERATRRRGPNRGREAEHLRDGRLRDDDRVVPLLGDVLDHAPPGLD